MRTSLAGTVLLVLGCAGRDGVDSAPDEAAPPEARAAGPVAAPEESVPPRAAFCDDPSTRDRCHDLSPAETRRFRSLLASAQAAVPSWEGFTRHVNAMGPSARGIGVPGAVFPLDTWVDVWFEPADPVQEHSAGVEAQITPWPVPCGPLTALGEGAVVTERPDLLVVEWPPRPGHSHIDLEMIVGQRAVDTRRVTWRTGTEGMLGAALPPGPADGVACFHVYASGPAEAVRKLGTGLDTEALRALLTPR